MTAGRPAAGIQVIARAGELLRALAAAPGGLSQAELAERLSLARTTVHRILGALEDEGLVAVSRSRGRYRLGPQIARLAESMKVDLIARVHPHLEALSRALDETVDLSVLEHGRVTFLDQVVARHTLRAVSAVGESFPAHSCAPGKAMLAGLGAQALRSALPSRLEALTPSTVTTLSALRRELSTVRERGYALDLEEHTVGICAVGAAVVTRDGTPMAISVPIPTQRFAGRELAMAERLQATCARIPPDVALTAPVRSLLG
ncbi:MAG: IclR family transcriptional regulator [Dermatophilaceae bacterium]